MSEVSDADKERAKKIWEDAHGAWRVWPQDGKNHFQEAAILCIAAFRAQARREGRREGIEAMRDAIIAFWEKEPILRVGMKNIANRLLEAEA